MITGGIVIYCVIGVLIGTFGLCAYLIESDRDLAALGGRAFFLCPVWPVLVIWELTKKVPGFITLMREMWKDAFGR